MSEYYKLKPPTAVKTEEEDSKLVTIVKQAKSPTHKDGDGNFQEFEINEIKSRRVKNEYLVKWTKNYPDDWIPEEDLNEVALEEARELNKNLEKIGGVVFKPKK